MNLLSDFIDFYEELSDIFEKKTDINLLISILFWNFWKIYEQLSGFFNKFGIGF